MLKKILGYIKYKVNSINSPEIISYKDSNKKKVIDTRVSNMTHISNKTNIHIGENVFIGHFNYIDGFKEVTIGEGCQITNYVSILTHSSHNSIRLHGEKYISQINNLKGLKAGAVEVGKYTYIGAHVTIMPGTKIGKGCIIGAYSYVDGDFPDFSILRGQPAVIIGNTTEVDDNFLSENPELRKTHYRKND